VCEGLSIIKVYNLNTKYKFHVAIMTAFLLSASTKTAAAVRGGGWSGDGRWGRTGLGSQMGSFGPLKVLTAQPETRFAERFLFWQAAVVVCARWGRNGGLTYAVAPGFASLCYSRCTIQAPRSNAPLISYIS